MIMKVFAKKKRVKNKRVKGWGKTHTHKIGWKSRLKILYSRQNETEVIQ